MRRKLWFCFFCIVLAGLAEAAPVSRDVARLRAAAFLMKIPAADSEGAPSLSRAAASPSGDEGGVSSLVEAASVEGRYYVFNVGRDEGFVVVGGDDCMEEVLGYAEHGTFDADAMPDNVRAWLDGLDELNGQGGRSAQIAQSAHQDGAARPAIRPLITTLWMQRAPYNGLCPEDTPSGCVATALAQVMKYYEWPKDSTAAIPAYGDYEELPPTVFDWSRMLSGYGGDEPQEYCDAVARLVLYCGHAVRTVYGSSSMASNTSIPAALRDYFNYDATLRVVERRQCTDEEWETLIYDELACGRPVIFSGLRLNTGHDFICDGYDGNGFYHFNWGWGGKYDGFFRLSQLNPYTMDTSLAQKDGYTMNQAAIVGIQPDQGGTVETPDDDEMVLTADQIRALEWTKSRRSVGQTFSVTVNSLVVNHTPVRGTFRYGLALMKDGVIVRGSERQTAILKLEPGVRTGHSENKSFSFGAGLTGTYRIVPISAVFTVSSISWQPAIDSDIYYIEVELTEKSLTLKEYPEADIVVNKVTTQSEYDRMAFNVTITNRGEDYCGPLSLIVNDYIVSSVGVIIAKGESDVVSFHFQPKEDGAQKYRITYSSDKPTVLAKGTVDFKATEPDSFVTWDSSGQLTRVMLDSVRQAVVPKGAAAADFRSLRPDTIIANDNPNCLYYVDAEEPCPIAGEHNVVIGTFADSITLTDGHDFYCPKTFTAGRIAYERTFGRGYDGAGGGWETIILPFDVQTVTPAGRGLIDWFRSPEDTGKDFWLMTYGGGTTFEHAQRMEANRPYLIAVPGGVYGDRSLTGVAVIFAADHGVVRQTALTSDGSFVGEYGQSGQLEQTASYQLNFDGSAFVGTTRPAAPFRVFIPLPLR